MRISPPIPPREEAFSSNRSELPDRLRVRETLSHTSGNILIRPKMIMINPLNPLKKLGGTLIKIVEALRSNVNIVREKARAKVILSGLNLSLPVIELPIMIGSSGRTQGAKTVSIPAKKDEINSVMSIKI